MAQEFQNLGSYLKERRLAVGLTQAEVSEKLKVHTQFVSNWERGTCAPPSHCFHQAIEILEADKDKLVKLMVLDSKIVIEAKVFKKKKSKAG